MRFPRGKKPERLLKRCLELTTEPGDLVLDVFGGSGTTAAVAQKMGRQWVIVEAGEQCRTHIRERLVRVMEGEDRSGVSRLVDAKPGGEFVYARLCPDTERRERA